MQYDNQFKQDEKVLKREDELTDVSKLTNIKADESLGQRERVKQGGINIEDDADHHGSQPSTMHSLSLENLSSANLDDHAHGKVSSIHEGTTQSDNLMSLAEGQLSNRASKKSAGSPVNSKEMDQEAIEAIHKGWEKATDTIAQGVEVVKRIIMQELPPVEGADLKEKAENLASKASEKIDEVKDKVESKVETLKESSQDMTNQASEKIDQTKEQVKEQGQGMKQGTQGFSSRASEQTDLFRSESGSKAEWQPTQQMKDVAHHKLDEYKEKFELPTGDFQSGSEFSRPESQQFSSQTSDKLGEIKDQARERMLQAQQSFDNWSTVSNEGSQAGYQPTGQESQQREFTRPESQPIMSQATEKLGEMKDKVKGQVQEAKESFQDWSNQGTEQREQSSSEGETVFKVEHGQETPVDKSSSDKIREIEELSQQLNKKVEELKKTTDIPSTGSAPTETIIIIQQGAQGTSTSQESQSQFTQGGQSMTDKISGKAQELKESFKETIAPQGSQEQTQEYRGSQETQSQERPKLGKRDEQQWRYQQSESQPKEGGQGFSDKISEKAQELKEGFRQGFEKGFEQPSSQSQSSEGERPREEERSKLGRRDEQQWRYQQGESQPTEGSQSLTGKLSDKIQEKASELKDTYKSNLEGFQRKADERQQEERPQEHHESEHHLTTESQSFVPTSESKSLVEQELLKGSEEQRGEEKGLKEKLTEKVEQVKEMMPSMTEEHPEHHLKAESESFQPSSESRSLLMKELLEKTEGMGLKEKLTEKVEQVKEMIPSSTEVEELAKKAMGKVEETSDKIISLDEAEKQDRSSEDKGESQLSQGPPAEMKESITYHPREIRGYEIEYVPKEHSEGEKSQSREQSESQEKSEGESKPVEERVPLLDRIHHGIENVTHTYQTIKGIFKPSQHQGEETQKSQGSEQKESQPKEHVQSEAPPAEMVETITYHPRDIRGYKIEYVPKDHHEGEKSQSQSQSQEKETQEQKDERHHYEYVKGNYIVEYIEKEHHEEKESQPKEGEGETKPVSDRVPLVDRVQHGMETVKGLFKSSKTEEKESLKAKAIPEGAEELSNILAQQAEDLKSKYRFLEQEKDQPKEKEVSQSQETQEAKGTSLIGKVQGSIHGLTDKISHGVSGLTGKFKSGKEETAQKEETTIESPREKIYEFKPTKKVEEKQEEKLPAGEEKETKSFVSKISGKISQGFGSVKGRFTSEKGETLEETSTEQNQSLLEKVQGKIQGKQTGEEVDKEGFRKVHDGFTESVTELKHEQNEEFLEQVEVANENPFEPLRTKQADFVDQPTSNVELVGGHLKEMTSGFKEEEQEMMPEEKDEEGQKKGIFQKVKAGLFSKFGHEGKENVESSDK